MKTKLMLLADHHNQKSSLNISLMNGSTVIRVMIYVTQIVKSLWMNSHLITGCFDVSRAWLFVGDFVFILPLNSRFYQLRQSWSFHKTHLRLLCGPSQTVLRHVDLVMLAMETWLREQEVARHGNMYTYLFLVGAGSQKKPKTLRNWVWRLLLMRNFFII